MYFDDTITGIGPPRVSPLYARAFDRFAPASADSPYAMPDTDKRRAFRQGLLNMAVALSKPNGGNFANSLATGLLAGSQSLDDAQRQYGNDAYRDDIMKRTQAEMAAKTQISDLRQHLMGTDGKLDPVKFSQYAMQDPEGAKQIKEVLQPEQKWSPVSAYINGAQGTLLSDGQGNLRTLDGQPFTGAGASPPVAPMQAPQVPGNLADAVQSVESGGNPNAVSPKGAVGLMQTMPGTLRDPGYGVTPARDSSPQEQARVGRDYLAALTGKYGTYGGLAAYNWGPGNWEASLSKYGTPDAALAHAPAETQAYVPKVMARAGEAPQQSDSALPFGFARKPPRPMAAPKTAAPAAPENQDAIDTFTADYIMHGKLPAMGMGATTQRQAVAANVAHIAKTLDLTPGELLSKSADFKAGAMSLQNLQKQSSMLERNERSFLSNADTMLALSDRVGRSGVPAFNSLLLKAKTNVQGDPDAASFAAARNIVAQEYAKIAAGATGAQGSTDSAQAHALALIDNAQTPQQLRAVIKTLHADADQQKQANASAMDDLRKNLMGIGRTASGSAPAKQKTVVKTGIYNGRKVVKYSDGTIDYAN